MNKDIATKDEIMSRDAVTRFEYWGKANPTAYPTTKEIERRKA